MNEWITEEDWSTVKIGDQVRVKRNGGMLTGEVIYRLGRECDPPWGIELDVATLAEYLTIKRSEWSLFVPAKPAVVLPTERGIYLDRYSMLWTHEMLNGGLVFRHAGESWERSDAARYAPFTRLEPVAVTAKKVLDRLRYRLPAFEWFGSLADDICDEFGVTDE